MFNLAEPDRCFQRAAVDIDRIGFVGSPRARFAHQVAQKVQNIVRHGLPTIADGNGGVLPLAHVGAVREGYTGIQ